MELRRYFEMTKSVSLSKLTAVFASLLVAFATASAATPAPAPPQGMVDLVLGKPYTITSLVSIAYSFGPSEASYYTPGALTDGQIASSVAFSDPEWQEFTRGGARSLVIDMGEVNTVHQMQERFLNYPSAGIYFPRTVTYSLSMNDTDWSVVGIVNSSIPLTSKVNQTQTYAVSGLNYQARYVKMTFTVDVNEFADEFQVFGDSGVVGNATIPKITPPVTYPNAYLAPGSPQVGGIRNMVLIPNGYYSANPAIENNTVSQLIPYVGYQSPSGAITDFMFDAVLFTPYGAAPSGGNYGDNNSTPTNMSDWVYFLDNTFSPTYNLAALDSATAVVKKDLNDPSYKEKVEIAIPYPCPSDTDFGTINGTQEDLSKLADQEQVLSWYVDQVLSRWDSAGYTNLKLVGFYWYSESAGFAVNDSEIAMLNYIGNYITGKGKVLNWIPFKDASGFADWSTLGFDGAWMQPNYSFSSYPPQELAETAAACKKLGMGIELEIHWNALTDSTLRDKYYQYLNYGVADGYMTGATHAYYQNSGPGTFYTCAESTNPILRKIYDATYQFIKGIYEPITAVSESADPVPQKFNLGNNYPNPFNPTTTINVTLAKSGMMSLRIYNVLGQLVKVVDQGFKAAGLYKCNVNMDNFASGVYFYRLQQGNNFMTKKMLLLK